MTNITLQFPDDIANSLISKWKDLPRAVLESVALEGYRSEALTNYEVRRLLGFETRYELDGFLKRHNVWEKAYSVEDFEKDKKTLRSLQD